MYRYDDDDQRLIEARVAQFRDQTNRYLRGELDEEDYRPLRLQNGLYRLRHASMLRIAIPYGLATAAQLRRLARIARQRRLGDLHFTTRQNVQVNGPALAEVPEILAELAQVQMHAIQTSGNCIRGITTDYLAGIAADERVDPRPWCELLRQWSHRHPEFTRLPRKFKLAVSGADEDRALLQVHDLGLAAHLDAQGEVAFRVLVGGGLGRSPMLALELTPSLHWRHLLTYCEAILRVYDRHGRRDDIHKSRLKFLVRTLGRAAFGELVEAEWAGLKDGPGTLTAEAVQRVSARFADPPAAAPAGSNLAYRRALEGNRAFAAWARHNVRAHRQPGHAIVTLSTKRSGVAPGDVSPGLLERIAAWADDYSLGEVRVSQRQNLILPQVRERDLRALWIEVREAGLANPNVGLLTDLVACPGGRYCDLSRVPTAPLADAIQARFARHDLRASIGPLDIRLSGCVNGCAQHAVGHIGIRGVEKAGASSFQISLGGSAGQAAGFGALLGPALPEAEVPEAIDRLIGVYLDQRQDGEPFLDTLRRIGREPFGQALLAPRARAEVVNG